MKLISLVIVCFLPLLFAQGQESKIVLLNESKSWNKGTFSFAPFHSNMFILGREALLKSGAIGKGKYSVEIQKSEPLLIGFSANWKRQPVILFPGDTLRFRLTDNDTLPYQFEGTRPKDELMFYSHLGTVKELGITELNNYNITPTARLNYKYVVGQTLDRYNARKKFLRQRTANGRMTQEGIRLIEKEFYYKYLSELFFAYYKSQEPGFDNSVIPDYYKKRLKQHSKAFGIDSLMYIRSYRTFTYLYGRFHALNETGAKNLTQNDLLNFYKKNMSGEVRDQLIFDELYEKYFFGSDASSIAENLDAISQRPMRDTLGSAQRKLLQQFSADALNALLEDSLGNSISLKELLSKNSNIHYVDLWATWCSPCLMEMPDSQKLTETFNDKDVQFVCLSVDTDRGKWKRKIGSLPAGKKVRHYRFIDGPAFMKTIGIDAIPRYILTGASGRVLNFDAPRPGWPVTQRLILSALESN